MTGEVLTPDQELLDALQSPGDFAMPGNEGRGHGEKTAWELLADTRNEMVAMRHDFHEDIVILDQSITELSKAIRGNGGPGLQTTTLRLDDRIKRLEETL